MKKLMILGGSHYIKPIIEIAHELDIYVITCDYLPFNYAHSLSDEYVNISILDRDGVLKKAIELSIDGIISFACDPGVLTAAYVADKMSLPSVGPYSSVEILQNKDMFRRFLKENGFNVPWSKTYTCITDVERELETFCYPLIVKPVDSAGSKGVRKVCSKEEIQSAFENAMDNSFSKKVIIEEYIEQKGYASDCDSFSENGILKYVSFSDQWFDNGAKNPFTPAAFLWPSSMEAENRECLTADIQRLINLLNMSTSIYNIETRVGQNNRAYIMELSPRGGGNRLAECIKYIYGVDIMKAYICSSVGMEYESDFDDISEERYGAEVILHSEKKGIFSTVVLDDCVKKYVYDVDIWKKKGDEIREFTGANETIGTIIFKADSRDILEDILLHQKKYMKVLVE